MTYFTNAQRVILFNTNTFTNSAGNYRLISFEQCEILVSGSNPATFTLVENEPDAENIGRSVSYLEFSPNSAFLYATSGGNTGNGFLIQIDLQNNVFNNNTPCQIRAIKKTNAPYPNATSGLYDISSSYDGNLYIVKQNQQELYILPKDIANNYLPQDLTTGDFDFSNASNPNITFSGGNIAGELPDQIDGYNYIKSHVIQTEVAIKGVDCNGICTTKSFSVEIFDSETKEVVGTYEVDNCSTTIDFCANYFTKYSIRELLTRSVFEDAIYEGVVNYPNNTIEFEFVVETNCGNVCNAIDLAIDKIEESCNVDSVELTITISNIGKNKTQSSIPLTLYANSISNATKLKTHTITTPIASNQTIDVTITIPRAASQQIIAQINDDGSFPSIGSFPVTSYTECEYTNNTKTISIAYPYPTVELGSNVNLCDGVSHTLTAPDGFKSYLWLPNYSTAKTLTIFETGKYTLEVTDMCNKKYTDFVEATYTDNPIVWKEFSVCDSDAPIICNATPTGGIYIGNGITGNTFDPKIAGTGTHVLTYETKVNSCTYYKQISVEVYPGIDIQINQYPNLGPITNISMPANSLIDISPVVVGGTKSYTDTWTYDDSFLNIEQHSDYTTVLSNQYGGTYILQYSVTDNNSCKATEQIPVEILISNCDITFPNTITPGNSENNKFYPVYTNGIIETGYELRIYNRWGELVWQTEDIHEAWDGMHEGVLSKQDVYVYHCKALCTDIDYKTKQHIQKTAKGDITVLR